MRITTAIATLAMMASAQPSFAQQPSQGPWQIVRGGGSRPYSNIWLLDTNTGRLFYCKADEPIAPGVTQDSCMEKGKTTEQDQIRHMNDQMEDLLKNRLKNKK
ncbi:MAG TPA: hypothetical protein VF957_23590 [Bradyrhizobium sp.]